MIKILLISFLFMSGCTEYQGVYGCTPQMFVLVYTIAIELMILYIFIYKKLGNELTKRNLLLYHITRGE